MKVENFLKIALLIDLLDLYTTGLPLNQRAKQLVNRCVVANKNFVRFLDKGMPYGDLDLIGQLSDEISDILDRSITYDEENNLFRVELKLEDNEK